jgi:antitoxin (DNA-binding transcriptional repressor) of toxin-antitoxin stability system
MKVTATELANEGEAVLARVIQGEIAEVQLHGKTVAAIQRKVGADRKEMVELLRDVNFTKADTRHLKQAMDAAAEVFGYAGRD